MPRINKVLIANRGEIAVRIIRTLKKLGIRSVAIYSDADSGAMHVKIANEAYNIGPPNPLKSYLNVEAIIEVAKRSNVDAVHPGYGFLAENYKFAKAVEDLGIIWIGPPSKVMEKLESKTFLRSAAAKVGVPVVPGSLRPITKEEVMETAKKIGFPVLLKADKGGGGKGIRKVNSPEELNTLFETASREALIAFGSDELYVEKYLERPRHIEVQVLMDQRGNIVTLGERECSLQRRYQKIIEEAPSPVVNKETREYISQLATLIVREVGCINACTVEFLRDMAGNFYLSEINKRIQVEHPVTEMVTGIDIVEWQVRIASGEQLSLKNVEEFGGHAIEARVYAEDPDNNFMPSPGVIVDLRIPERKEVRVDHALEIGTRIPPYYDPLIAKVIAHGRARLEAIHNLANALEEFKIQGIKTSIPFLLKLLRSEEFIGGEIDTQLVERKYLVREKNR
jgi:acetyl-CoA carboxylase biotin carboxylase subunit